MNRLPWRRSFEPQHEDYTAFGADGVSYARVYFNITAPTANYRWLWAVSVAYQFNENGSAETREEAVERATASYWRQLAKSTPSKTPG